MTVRDLISLLEEAESYFPKGLDTQLHFDDGGGYTFAITDAEIFMADGVVMLRLYED